VNLLDLMTGDNLPFKISLIALCSSDVSVALFHRVNKNIWGTKVIALFNSEDVIILHH
jgi:hypothetical protein